MYHKKNQIIELNINKYLIKTSTLTIAPQNNISIIKFATNDL